MAGIEAFEEHAGEYDAWFDEHHAFYQSELNAIKQFISGGINGLEIGIGTGRFAVPLGIRTGIDPAQSMIEISQSKGLNVEKAKAEALPYSDGRFEFTLMVNVLCFADDTHKALREAWRVTQKGGYIVIAFFDKNGILAKEYLKKKENSVFYKSARFYSVKEVAQMLHAAGYKDPEFRQTIFDLKEDRFYDVREGSGEGGFVAVRAKKPE